MIYVKRKFGRLSKILWWGFLRLKWAFKILVIFFFLCSWWLLGLRGALLRSWLRSRFNDRRVIFWSRVTFLIFRCKFFLIKIKDLTFWWAFFLGRGFLKFLKAQPLYQNKHPHIHSHTHLRKTPTTTTTPFNSITLSLTKYIYIIKKVTE